MTDTTQRATREQQIETLAEVGWGGPNADYENPDWGALADAVARMIADAEQAAGERVLLSCQVLDEVLTEDAEQAAERRGAVKALRSVSQKMQDHPALLSDRGAQFTCAIFVEAQAEFIENGADL